MNKSTIKRLFLAGEQSSLWLIGHLLNHALLCCSFLAVANNRGATH